MIIRHGLNRTASLLRPTEYRPSRALNCSCLHPALMGWARQFRASGAGSPWVIFLLQLHRKYWRLRRLGFLTCTTKF